MNSTEILEYYISRDKILEKVAEIFRLFMETSDPLEKGYRLMLLSKEIDDAGL